jgi:TPP-dependent trihydroxycyclohexane-1,2-dione (THcHDO) dehydratase
MKFLIDKVYGVDKCAVVESAPMAELVSSATIVNSEFGPQVCMTAIGGGVVYAQPKGALKDLPVGSQVPVATSTIELVANAETGHKSYRAR